MKNNNNVKDLSKRWFNSAERDLNTAKRLFDVQHFTDIICFHAQQTVEKCLKGFLVWHRTKPPRIHDLPRLLKECTKIDTEFSDWEDECAILNHYYLESRYPPSAPIDYSRSETKRALEYTEELIRFTKKKIHN